MHFKEDILCINYPALALYNLTLKLLRGYDLS